MWVDHGTISQVISPAESGRRRAEDAMGIKQHKKGAIIIKRPYNTRSLEIVYDKCLHC